MAWTEFYVDSGGSDVAAGTVQNAAASVTSTNGAWSTATNIFTPAGGGTPFSGVSAGEYASIYLDAATVAVFIGQIASVNSGGATITIDGTIRYGTPPSTGASGRSCKVGGSHLSELPWASGGLGATTCPQPTRINWKEGTYTIVASRTFSIAGTTTAPMWFRGYNTTPGDCDQDPSLARPVLALNATFAITPSGADQTWSSFNVTGNRTSTIWNQTGTNGRVVRCQFENTSSNAGAVAYQFGTGSALAAYCWFKTPSTATTTGVASMGQAGVVLGCVAEGGGSACFNSGASNPTYIQCIALGSGTAVTGFGGSTGAFKVIQCTVYDVTGSGIVWTGTPTAGAQVVNCLLASCGAYGINNGSGTNTDNVFRACNDFFDCTSGNENGFGDAISWFEQNESGNPFVSATDLTPIATSEAFQQGFAPGGFENQTFATYESIGAVDPASTGSTGSVHIIGG